MHSVSSHRIDTLTCAFIFSLTAFFAPGQPAFAQGERPPLQARNGSVPAAAASPTPPVIVMGFVGGFIRHDNIVHSEVQLAARLRKAYPVGVDVEIFESYRGESARERIHTLLDTNHEGTLTPAEKQNARIILYGHSWGASEAITVARELEKDGIHVLLTVQVDSISKMRQNDEVIPANVAQAVNFYQPDGFVHGQSAIRAADPTRTKIIGNFRFDYKTSPLYLQRVSLVRLGLREGPHANRMRSKSVETGGGSDSRGFASDGIERLSPLINFAIVIALRLPNAVPLLSNSAHTKNCLKVNSL
jgi:hypothetical protein